MGGGVHANTPKWRKYAILEHFRVKHTLKRSPAAAFLIPQGPVPEFYVQDIWFCHCYDLV